MRGIRISRGEGGQGLGSSVLAMPKQSPNIRYSNMHEARIVLRVVEALQSVVDPLIKMTLHHTSVTV